MVVRTQALLLSLGGTAGGNHTCRAQRGLGVHARASEGCGAVPYLGLNHALPLPALQCAGDLADHPSCHQRLGRQQLERGKGAQQGHGSLWCWHSWMLKAGHDHSNLWG